MEEFLTACYKNDVPTVRNLISLVNINERGSDGEPALYKAMRYNNKAVVKMLLARPEIQLGATDTLYSWTGLHAACFRNNPQCVELFLASSLCNNDIVRQEDRNGKTAEMVATQADNKECSRLIIDYLVLHGFSARPQEKKMTRVPRVYTEPARLTLEQLSYAIEKIEADEAAFVEESEAEIAKLEKQLNEYKMISAGDLLYIQNRKDELRAEFDRRAEVNSQTPIPSAPPPSLIPECPVCLEEMRPPLQIYNCSNGHLICSICEQKISSNACTSRCGGVYTGRATAMEQMVRQILGIM